MRTGESLYISAYSSWSQAAQGQGRHWNCVKKGFGFLPHTDLRSNTQEVKCQGQVT